MPSGDKPQPMIFAIMRNGHEVIRGDVLDVQDKLQEGDVAAAKGLWADMRKWEGLHAKMEEGTGDESTTSPKGFFHVLDETCDNVATLNGLFSTHVDLEQKAAQVDASLEGGDDCDKVLAIFTEFATMNEDHLKKEEDIMMPKVMEMKKKGEPLKKIMMDEILPLVADEDEEFFVSHACTTLETHSNNMPRARVFVHALWAASTPEQWTKRKEIAKTALSEDVWREIEGLTSTES